MPGNVGGTPVLVVAWLLVAAAVGDAADSRVIPPQAWPASSDYTTVSWLQGFPGREAKAPWHRCIRTGRYAFVLDTATMAVPHVGGVEAVPYAVAVRSAGAEVAALPAADLGLFVKVDGTTYRCTAGHSWDGLAGPRLIESGRWMQRNDVDGLTFLSHDGTPLNVNARFETVAWPDRMTLILAVQPGFEPIIAGTDCFGRVGGGFGLDGTNHAEVRATPAADPARFTFECWVYAPPDFDAATSAFPWLVCKGPHEQADGNYGITIQGGVPHARLNIGGGRDNAFSASANARLNLEAWNHVALSYDGVSLRMYLNGRLGDEKRIDRERVPAAQGLALGRRQDNSGDGYHFKGVVDEVAIYDRALSGEEIRQRFRSPEKPVVSGPPVHAESFAADGNASPRRPQVAWDDVELAIRIESDAGLIEERRALADGVSASDWHEVAITFDPAGLPSGLEALPRVSSLSVEATPVMADPALPAPALPVRFDALRDWYGIDLDSVEPMLPPDAIRGPADAASDAGAVRDHRNDILDRVQLVLSNASDAEQAARLCFTKTTFAGQRVGSPITGLSAILRDAAGQPTGIPVQLSKNWHRGRGGSPYDSQWFHGFTQVRLPPRATVRLELVMAYGHWGGVPAASHAQLSLLGWGSNQLWEESAMGSWGESICYEPDQVQAGASILDVRPMLVRSLPEGKPWQWTGNVGGGDFFRLEAADGSRVSRRNMKAEYVRPGPCLTEVNHAGQLGSGVDHAATVSISRTDDIVRGTYRVRMDVREPVEFSRCVIFQVGADSYSQAGARKIAVGNATGLVHEWDAQWGGATYRTAPTECRGSAPWVSLHGVDAASGTRPAASLGLVIREWRAVLGGGEALPWVAEHGTPSAVHPSSTVDIVPPPGVRRLERGDFVEATIEHVVLPLSAEAYYGPNESLRTALREMANSWQMVHREATGNDRRVEVTRGRLVRSYPAIHIETDDGVAEYRLRGGLGRVPLTFARLASHRAGELRIDGVQVDQSVHSADFWQTDYDPVTRTWSQTFTVDAGKATTAGDGQMNVLFRHAAPQ